MASPVFSLDLKTQVTCLTGAADQTIQVPAQDTKITQQEPASWWFLMVTGVPVWAAQDTAALADITQNAIIPVGLWPVPVRFPPGVVLHFLATSGAGSVSIVRARMAA